MNANTETRFGETGPYQSTPWGVLNEEFLQKFPIASGWRINFRYENIEKSVMHRIECQLIDVRDNVVCSRSSIVSMASCANEDALWGTTETNAFYRLMKAVGIGGVDSHSDYKSEREISALVTQLKKPKVEAVKSVKAKEPAKTESAPKVESSPKAESAPKAETTQEVEVSPKAESAPKVEHGPIAEAAIELYRSNGLELAPPTSEREAMQAMDDFDACLEANGPKEDAEIDAPETAPKTKPAKAKKKAAKKVAKKTTKTPQAPDVQEEAVVDPDQPLVEAFEDEGGVVVVPFEESDDASVEMLELDDQEEESPF